MNLFVLDVDPVNAAIQNCDKHVCKIILEAAQMVMLSYHVYGIPDNPPFEIWNAKTHKNNHLSKWVRENTANYMWTVKHGLALCDEYEYRYGKIHKVKALLEWCGANPPKTMPDGEMTTFRQAVAEDCYHDDVVEAYRKYYIKYKASFAKWTKRPVPEWFVKAINGGVAEWSNASVLKTEEVETLPGVRIPPPPPIGMRHVFDKDRYTQG